MNIFHIFLCVDITGANKVSAFFNELIGERLIPSVSYRISNVYHQPVKKKRMIEMEIMSRKKMCFFILVFVALFAKLSSQKIIRVVDEPYYDYDGASIVV